MTSPQLRAVAGASVEFTTGIMTFGDTVGVLVTLAGILELGEKKTLCITVLLVFEVM